MVVVVVAARWMQGAGHWSADRQGSVHSRLRNMGEVKRKKKGEEDERGEGSLKFSVVKKQAGGPWVDGSLHETGLLSG